MNNGLSQLYKLFATMTSEIYSELTQKIVEKKGLQRFIQFGSISLLLSLQQQHHTISLHNFILLSENICDSLEYMQYLYIVNIFIKFYLIKVSQIICRKGHSHLYNTMRVIQSHVDVSHGTLLVKFIYVTYWSM